MKKDFETLVNEIIVDAEKEGEPLTRKEAEEIAKMELGAKQIKHYEKSTAPKEKKKRPRKIDKDKQAIIEILRNALAKEGYQSRIVNDQREIAFDEFSVILVRHRKKSP